MPIKVLTLTFMLLSCSAAQASEPIGERMAIGIVVIAGVVVGTLYGINQFTKDNQPSGIQTSAHIKQKNTGYSLNVLPMVAQNQKVETGARVEFSLPF